MVQVRATLRVAGIFPGTKLACGNFRMEINAYFLPLLSVLYYTWKELSCLTLSWFSKSCQYYCAAEEEHNCMNYCTSKFKNVLWNHIQLWRANRWRQMEMYKVTYLTHSAEAPEVPPPELLLKDASRSTTPNQLVVHYSVEVAVMLNCTTLNIFTTKEQNTHFPFYLKNSLLEGNEKTFENNYHVNHISTLTLSTAYINRGYW